ncbi:glycosyltransferase [Neorhizobium sp. AL 9.2.2]|uniref:glycosyltransferase family protein n=1 Tax=Neorhizobium sp. AL 9.2.2 TaxID=2712894 RepID=UPI0015719BB1|nr:glycosyltransferase [Neorhizobium sp. AL 9.2.2]NSY19769.1 glycosyltransferase family 4 protein [Neorhizobium sp. AL 9.2.2]
MRRPSAIFVVNLIQDVNILRPLVLLAVRDLNVEVGLLVSLRFRQSDTTGRWLEEVSELAALCGIEIFHFRDLADSIMVLSTRRGILVAASESNLPAHAETHDLFRAAPPGFVTMTLQHGFEGVGFLHSREHDAAHGRGVTFAADIVCGWFDADRQVSMLPSQKPKLVVTGPSCVLNPPILDGPHVEDGPQGEGVPDAMIAPMTGLVCENLHSVRFTANAGTQGSFVEHFEAFCQELASDDGKVVLRPHPAGQFSVRNRLKLPFNARINNDPMYKVPLSSYAYGISAASSVIIDMLLAGIPVAVWRDDGDAMDASAYDGLTVVRTAQDWIGFAREAMATPEIFLERQRAFLDRQHMPYEACDVRERFIRLFSAACDASPAPPVPPRAVNRLLLASRAPNVGMTGFFNAAFPNLAAVSAFSFHPFPMAGIRKAFGIRMSPSAVAAWIETRLSAIEPTLIVVWEKDLSSLEVKTLVHSARRKRIPVAVFLAASNIEPGVSQDVSGDAALMQDMKALADVVCGPPARLSRFRPALEAAGIPSTEITGIEGHLAIATRRGSGNAIERHATQIRRLCNLDAKSRRTRVLFVSPAFLPTLQLSFVKPFESPAGKTAFAYHIITQEDVNAHLKKRGSPAETRQWIAETAADFAPDVIVFCRYGGPYEDVFLDYAAHAHVPTLYHIDDDLLNVPASIGEKKAVIHNDPARIAAVRRLLDETDLVYCSTDKLKDRLVGLGVRAPVRAGAIYCSCRVIAPAVLRPVRTFGYMASSDHAQNLDMILPAVTAFLRRNPTVRFELFGSIPKPEALAEFGERVATAPPIRNYETFLEEFAMHEWDVGICPLVPINFNMVKANTKWVEYTAIGAAVIASSGTVYDACASDGCGLLADSTDTWLAAFEALLDPQTRYAQVQRAQDRLLAHYTTEKLLEQVTAVIGGVSARFAAKGPMASGVSKA